MTQKGQGTTDDKILRRLVPRTERDRQVIALLRDGKSYQAVAEEMGLTRETVAGIAWRAKRRAQR